MDHGGHGRSPQFPLLNSWIPGLRHISAFETWFIVHYEGFFQILKVVLLCSQNENCELRWYKIGLHHVVFSKILVDSFDPEAPLGRFYDLDRIVCWDLSWGVWEAVRDDDRDAGDSDNGYPCIILSKDGKYKISSPSFDGTDDEDEAIKLFYDYSRPISPTLLAETLKSVSGYYLVGGNTYTMSLFHHMWDQR